jgi:hypothetical protein
MEKNLRGCNIQYKNTKQSRASKTKKENELL